VGKPLRGRPGRGARVAKWSIAASVVVTLGVAAFHWKDELTQYTRGAMASADVRPRPPVGEARLLMDQGFEQFSTRLGARERAKASPAPARPAASTKRPADTQPAQS
jgi:hypothetical protein